MLGPEEGIDHESAANCDAMFGVGIEDFQRRIGRLGTHKTFQLDAALKVALGLS